MPLGCLSASENVMPEPSTVITSLQNDTIKFIRTLEARKARRESGLFVAEGVANLAAARAAGRVPETVVTHDGAAHGDAAALVDWAKTGGARALQVTAAVMSKLTGRDNAPDALGVFRIQWAPPPSARDLAAETVWLALEGVRDPGNLGTILRTVEACGAAGIMLVGAGCDPHAPDCVQAAMGSLFKVPLVQMTTEAFLAWRPAWQGEVQGTHLGGQIDFRDARPRGPVLLVMGSEGTGLSDELSAACTQLVKIPIAPGVDSLNLAVATGLALYQLCGPRLQMR
jgi:RNA methyltransferase, TrmH family